LLKGVSLRIRQGEKVGIIGASGSGKTTLGYHLCAVHRSALLGRSQGVVSIAGRNVIGENYPGFAGMVLQNPEHQLFCETVEGEIALGLENMGKPPACVASVVQSMLELLDLKDLRGADIATLSHGQKQRVSIASMLAMAPRLLLLDEPTNFLDRPTADALFHTLSALNKEEGTTLVVIEHDLERLSSWATRILRMEDGRIAEELQPRALARKVTPGKTPPRPKKAANALMVDRIDFTYGRGSAGIRDISFTASYGEVIVLLGNNGAGKTTLLKCLKGLLKPSGGEIKLADGKALMDAVAMVFQNPDEQLFAFSVAEECGFVLENQGMTPESVRARVDEALANEGLFLQRERLPFTLSYGEKRRLSLASVMVGQPDILCLDEPTVALDQENLARLEKTIVSGACSGKTIFVSTHDRYFAQAVGTRFITLEDGRIVSDADSLPEIMA
jgi:energy-coupling factor transport system ATP-binding protein